MKECISDTIYEVIFCCDFEECTISDVTIDGVSCTDNGISFWLDFSIANNTNSTYEVAFNDNYLGTHLIDSLPMYFETGSTDMPNDFLVICETEETGCCFEWEIPGGLCGSGDCQIFDVFAEPYNCNDNGLFMVDIGFEYLNIEGNTFTILGNGNNYGTFEYGEPYYTLGPLEADCSTLLEFVIIDDTMDGCVGVFEFEEPICCSEVDCVISGLELYNIECNTNGDGYHVTLDFEYVGANGEDFVLSMNNGVFNQYSYADLPLRLNDLPIPEEATTFLVCQGGLTDCCLDAYLVQPNCGDKACEIFDVIAEAYNCDDNEGFLVDIAFAYQHTQANTFTLLGNGNNYGTYEYGQPYYTIGPLVADCETLYEFVIVDNTMDGCSAATWFEEPICCESNTDCIINAVEAFDEECSEEDGFYHVSINFNYSGTSNDFFDMYVNGEFYGFYAFADLPIRLNSIEVTDQTFIVICENDNEECCTELSIDPPSCNDSVGCEIFDVFAEAYDCEDGGFLVGLEFDYSETTSNTFTIVGNGNTYGTFEYGAEYYTIGPLEADCETIFEFVIVDNENEACSGFYVFDEPICCDDCPSEFTTSVDTTINGTLILSITTLPADGFFNLILNGDDFGNFNYGDDISFALDNDTEYAIVLTDIENSDCKYMESLLTTAAPTSTTEPSLLQGEVISRIQSLFFDFPIGSQFATYDCQGRQVMDGSVDSDNYSLQHQLPQGIYFINIWFNNQRSIKKVHLK